MLLLVYVMCVVFGTGRVNTVVGVCFIYSSGLVTEADLEHWQPDHIAPYVQVGGLGHI